MLKVCVKILSFASFFNTIFGVLTPASEMFREGQVYYSANARKLNAYYFASISYVTAPGTESANLTFAAICNLSISSLVDRFFFPSFSNKV